MGSILYNWRTRVFFLGAGSAPELYDEMGGKDYGDGRGREEIAVAMGSDCGIVCIPRFLIFFFPSGYPFLSYPYNYSERWIHCVLGCLQEGLLSRIVVL